MQLFRNSGIIIGIVGAFVAGACDPCAGTMECHTNDHVSYTGHLIEHATGFDVVGADITFIRTGGVSLASDTARSVTDSEGFFEIEASAGGPGEVTGKLHVAPPSHPAYDLSGLTLRTTNISGDGGQFGKLVADPYLLHVTQVLDSATSQPMARAAITFTRTAGIEVDPVVFTTTADASGAFIIAPRALAAGTVIGDLTVTPVKGQPRTASIRFGTRAYDGPSYEWNIVRLAFPQ